MSSQVFTRRRLLAAGGLAATVGLVGCSDKTKDTNTSDRNAAAVLPTYTPVDLVEPDLPGDELLMPGYFAYPADPKPVFDTPPGEGLGEISIMYTSFVPTPAGPSKNEFYAQLQKEIGADLKISFVPSDDYGAKFQTTIAGGDLPDLMGYPIPTPDQPKMVDKLFEDLGPYLGGDKAKDYPYLANIPTASWKPAVVNGSIFAVPQHRSLAGQAIYARTDLLKKYGANPEPASYDELVETMKTVTDAKKSRWAFANSSYMVSHILGMLEGPNNWSEQDGTFVSAYEDERYKQAVAKVAEMVKMGLFHPDSASVSYTKIRDLFFSGRISLTSDGYAGWDLFVRQLGGGEAGTSKLGLIVEPKYDGGGDGPHLAGTGYQGVTVIKKGLGEEKTRKLLNVLNFLATPIGSQEHLHRKYGVEGTDFTMEDGLPNLTDKGNQEFMDLQYVADSPTILGPGLKKGVEHQHQWHQRIAKNLIHDPSIGLYSDTWSRDGASAGKIMSDAISAVIFGRKPLSAYDEAVKSWKSKAGDKIAAEFAEDKNSNG